MRDGRRAVSCRMIVVVGSLNMDVVVRVKEYPKPGETILGSDYETTPGGKGANQAVAAARMGAEVRMIGKVGRDDYGRQLVDALAADGVATDRVVASDAPTGAAFISVLDSGENTIIVSSGANFRLEPDDLSASDFEGCKVLLLQLEVPLPTMRRAAELATAAGAYVILNAAPAMSLTKDDLANVDLLVVNELEAHALCGVLPNSEEEAFRAMDLLRALGADSVLLTMGARGAVWLRDGQRGSTAAYAIEPVDTTGAGDSFIGALGAALADGLDWEVALSRASATGALTATREGAQRSMPRKADVEAFMAESGHRREAPENER